MTLGVWQSVIITETLNLILWRFFVLVLVAAWRTSIVKKWTRQFSEILIYWKYVPLGTCNPLTIPTFSNTKKSFLRLFLRYLARFTYCMGFSCQNSPKLVKISIKILFLRKNEIFLMEIVVFSILKMILCIIHFR